VAYVSPVDDAEAGFGRLEKRIAVAACPFGEAASGAVCMLGVLHWPRSSILPYQYLAVA
jgi:hypothetical protein